MANNSLRDRRLEELAVKINKAYADMLTADLEIGRHLKQVKAVLTRDQFREWSRSLGFSPQRASHYIRIAEASD